MNFWECLPAWISDVVKQTNNVREIRLRNHASVKVNVSGIWYYCGENVLTQSFGIAKKLDVPCDTIVNKACNNSIFAYESMLTSGYFTLQDGSRFGVAGEYSATGNSFKNYTSVCIRIPQSVSCVNEEIMQKISGQNVLILGKPGFGKTTLLRDIAKKLAFNFNVAVIDERGELSLKDDLVNCDILKWTSKIDGIYMALRCLSPDYIVCDELAKSDCDAIQRAKSGGVNVCASLHASNLADVDAFSKTLKDIFTVIILCKEVGNYVFL